MIIKCRSKSGADLPAVCLDPRVGIDSETEFALTVGKSYVVYAFTVYLAHIWYYILNDDGHEWPTWAPSPLFDVIDGSIPKGWRYGYFRFDAGEQYPIVSFPEWAEDHAYYERLVDGGAYEREVFLRWRRVLELPDHV